MIVLTGKTCSGKSTVQKQLMDYGYRKVVTYTTRPQRPHEIDGEDYHFVTDRQFADMYHKGYFAETDSYITESGEWWYGSDIKDYSNDKYKVIVLTPNGIKMVREKFPWVDLKVFYLDTPEDVIRQRLKDRGDNPQEAIRRMKADNNDFADIYSNTDFVVDGCDNVCERILSKLV